MGICFSKKKIVPLDNRNKVNNLEITNQERKTNNFEDFSNFINYEYEKVNNNLIKKYGSENVRNAIGMHWWFLKTKIVYENTLYKEINDNIYSD